MQIDQFDVGLIPPLLSVYLSVCFSLFAFARSRHRKEILLFVLLCFLVSMRPVQFLVQRVVTDVGVLMRFERGILFGYAFIPFVGVLFFHRILKIRKPRIEAGLFACSLLMAMGSMGPWLLAGLQTYPWGVIGKAGPFFPLYVVYAAACFGYMVHCTVTAMKISRDREVWLKHRYLFVSLLGGTFLLFGTAFEFTGFTGNSMYPIVNFMFVPLGVMAYGVLRHRILDIFTVVHIASFRLIYGGVFLLPNLLIFYALKPLLDGEHVLPLIFLLPLWYAVNHFCAVRIHPEVSRRFNRYPHHLRTAESKFARDLLILRDTRSLVTEFGELVRSTLCIGSIRFFFAPVGDPVHLTDMDGEIVTLNEATTAWLVTADCFIDPFVLTSDSLTPPPGVRIDLMALFDRYDGLCLVPLVQYDQLIGLVVFADKQGSVSMMPMEIKFLEKVSRYLSIALYNSRVYQAVTSVKDQLELRRRELSREILERRRAEESLRRSEGRYNILADNILDTLVVVGVNDQMIKYASPSCQELTGYTPEEIVGEAFLGFLTKSSGRELAQMVPPSQEGGSFMVELEHIRKGGAPAWAEVSGHFIATGDGGMEVVGLARDISERRVAEMEKEELRQKLRQAQKMESIGVLAGGIAHDFNNILMAILGYAQLGAMYLEDKDSKASGVLAQIEKAGLRAKELISQILAFSRQDEQARRSVDFATLTRESLGLIRPIIPEGVAIHSDFPEAPVRVVADPVQIHQIVANLCTNASHALEGVAGGGIEVRVCRTTLDAGEARRHGLEPGAFGLLQVSDTGHGMEADIKTRIFEPYFTTKGLGKGTGMGLAVVQGIILSHNGAVVVESSKERGSLFSVYLPEAQGETEILSSPHEAGKVCGGRVLFVDDETMLVDLAGEALSRMGFEVVALDDPEEAVAVFARDPSGFDVVVTDMTMPHMSGLKLAERIRALNEKTPVILCTGFSNELLGRRHEDMGVSAVLFKPVPMKELAEAIHGVRCAPPEVLQESPVS
ncbi:response regulator [Desulfoluna sp.]|uniref:hybrid sensor histidine kinase/response regulator n=1 Tax=Desulfoluna sp. TaxID=2045199 RepID=UPI00260CB86F|nr:response regulator [Desulfoluna sp.]